MMSGQLLCILQTRLLIKERKKRERKRVERNQIRTSKGEWEASEDKERERQV